MEQPDDIRSDGLDEEGRPKWIVSGLTADEMACELVCALDRDREGELTVLITLWWS